MVCSIFYKNLHLHGKIFLLTILNALLETVSFIVAFITWNERREAFNLPRNRVYLECFWKGLKLPDF